MLGLVRASLQRSSSNEGKEQQQHLLASELEAKRQINALTGGKNCEVLNHLATALISSSEVESAAELLLQATEMCEWDDLAWSNLAYALHLQGLRSDARAAQRISEQLREDWMKPNTIKIGQKDVKV